jgi:regulator of extracellular matrix RemA (YlzA/DUF370 family)
VNNLVMTEILADMMPSKMSAIAMLAMPRQMWTPLMLMSAISSEVLLDTFFGRSTMAVILNDFVSVSLTEILTADVSMLLTANRTHFRYH